MRRSIAIGVLGLAVASVACSDETRRLPAGHRDGAQTDSRVGDAGEISDAQSPELDGGFDAGVDAGLDPACDPSFGSPVPLNAAAVGQRVVIAGSIYFPPNAAVVAPAECRPLMQGLRPAWLRPDDVTPAGENLELVKEADGRGIPCGCPFGEDPRCDSVPLEEGRAVWVRGLVSRMQQAECSQIPCYKMDPETFCRVP